jgi:hypothetical protein
MRALIIALLLFIPFASNAQFDKDCKGLFLDGVKNLKNTFSDSGEGALTYNVTTTLAEGGKEVSELVKVVFKGSKSKIETSKVMIYQDDRTMVTINNNQKTIFFGETTLNKQWKLDGIAAMGMIQDTLLQYLHVNYCETTCPDNNKKLFEEKIEMTLEKRYEGFSGISKLTYWIRHSDKMITRMQVDYVDGNKLGVKSISLRIVEINSKIKGAVFQGTATAMVRNGDGTLKSAYKNFQIFDYQKKR